MGACLSTIVSAMVVAVVEITEGMGAVVLGAMGVLVEAPAPSVDAGTPEMVAVASVEMGAGAGVDDESCGIVGGGATEGVAAAALPTRLLFEVEESEG